MNSSFKIPYTFSYMFRNLINQSVELSVFNWSYFFHFFFFKPIHVIYPYTFTMIGLTNSSSISFLIFVCLSFNSVSFNSIKPFPYLKRLFFAFKKCFSIFSQYFGFPSLYFKKKNYNFIETINKCFTRFIKVLI